MRWTDTGDTNEKNDSKVNHMHLTESTVGAQTCMLNSMGRKKIEACMI
jgi:hypothetical protein